MNYYYLCLQVLQVEGSYLFLEASLFPWLSERLICGESLVFISQVITEVYMTNNWEQR